MTIPDASSIDLILRAGVRTIAVTFDGYNDGPIRGRTRDRLHAQLDDAIEAVNAEITRQSGRRVAGH